MRSISAFFPAYNDAGTIGSLVVLTDCTLRRLANDYEIIVVNDGSEDHTAQVLSLAVIARNEASPEAVAVTNSLPTEIAGLSGRGDRDLASSRYADLRCCRAITQVSMRSVPKCDSVGSTSAIHSLDHSDRTLPRFGNDLLVTGNVFTQAKLCQKNENQELATQDWDE